MRQAVSSDFLLRARVYYVCAAVSNHRQPRAQVESRTAPTRAPLKNRMRITTIAMVVPEELESSLLAASLDESLPGEELAYSVHHPDIRH